jgi:hypothetical protein
MTRTGTFCVSALIAFFVFVLPTTIIAVGASKERLRQVIEWVQREGHPNVIVGMFASALGIPTLNDADLPIISKAYRTESGSIYSFALANVNGRQEVILELYNDVDYYGWRMSEDLEKVIKTVYADAAHNVTRRDGLASGIKFEQVVAAFFAKLSLVKSK